jgi:hypothetical protein
MHGQEAVICRFEDFETLVNAQEVLSDLLADLEDWRGDQSAVDLRAVGLLLENEGYDSSWEDELKDKSADLSRDRYQGRHG